MINQKMKKKQTSSIQYKIVFAKPLLLLVLNLPLPFNQIKSQGVEL